MQRVLDPASQTRYAQTHQGGLLGVGSDMGMSPSLKTTQEVVLFPPDVDQLTSRLFSDWG